MRGQQSLFSNLFENQKKNKERRNRNIFLPQRNEALIYRYYYHADMRRLRYDDCLKALEHEFYITESRILNILPEYTDLIKSIIREEPTIKSLEEQFPHFNWRLKRLK